MFHVIFKDLRNILVGKPVNLCGQSFKCYCLITKKQNKKATAFIFFDSQKTFIFIKNKIINKGNRKKIFDDNNKIPE